jgi:hypothetical protein
MRVLITSTGLQTVVATKPAMNEAVKFRGWVPSFIRLGPHTIATFLFLEEHKKLYRKLKGVYTEDISDRRRKCCFKIGKNRRGKGDSQKGINHSLQFPLVFYLGGAP